MTTCSECVDFEASTETCTCPLNAYPSAYDIYDWNYARTAANSESCAMFRKIPVVVVQTTEEKQ